MTTLVLGTPPPELEALLARRRHAGADRLDEVWQGVLHMVPGPSFEHARVSQQLAEVLGPLADAAGLLATMSEFNLGQSERDFRVPDGGLHRPGAAGVWLSTAAVVVEIISPDDESWQKLPFYAEHHVDEVLLVDPAERTVTWLALRDGAYEPVQRSGLIELGATELAERLRGRHRRSGLQFPCAATPSGSRLSTLSSRRAGSVISGLLHDVSIDTPMLSSR